MIIQPFIFCISLILSMIHPNSADASNRKRAKQYKHYAIPQELRNEFTFNGRIPIVEKPRSLIQASNPFANVFTTSVTAEQICEHFANIRKIKECYGPTESDLSQAFMKFIPLITEEKMRVFSPPFSFEELLPSGRRFSAPVIGGSSFRELPNGPLDPALKGRDCSEPPILQEGDFRSIFCVGIEQSGLGILREPLNPDEDIQTMRAFKTILKNDGLLFLSIPVGKDCLVWGSHRVYGHLRLKALLQGWRILGYFGFTSENLEVDTIEKAHYPVFVLKPIE